MLPAVVEPVEETPHLGSSRARRRRLVVDALAADRAGDDLHRPASSSRHAPTVILRHAAAPGREQRRVPARTVARPSAAASYCRVASSIISTTPSTLRSAGVRRADIHAEPPRDRGAHLIGIEHFALDLAVLTTSCGQGLQHGLVPQRRSRAPPCARSAGPADDARRPVIRRGLLESNRNSGQSGNSWM